MTTPFTSGVNTGIGFSTFGEDFGGALQTNVSADMRGVNASLYSRISFPVDDPALPDELLLRMKYDDGFVAYLNGQKIAERNAPDPPAWNSSATDSRSVAEASAYEEIDVSEFVGALRAGTNVLAIHGMNVDAADGDFLILPQLVGKSDSGFLRYMASPSPGAPNAAGTIVNPPEFSRDGGIVTEEFALELTADASFGGVIRYTLNGTAPTASSTEYTSPIVINRSTQVRAKLFEPGMDSSPVATEAYVMLAPDLLDFSSNLPLVVVDTFGRGIQGKDRYFGAAHMIIIEAGEEPTVLTDSHDIDTRIGIRTRGSSSGGWPKHHYRLETWNEVSGLIETGGEMKLNDQNISPFGLPSHSDWILSTFYTFDRALMRNPLIYELSNQAGRYAARTQHVEVFLNDDGNSLSNADYFGVYAFMEAIRRDDDRVDVQRLYDSDNTAPNVTGGYVFKEDRSSTSLPCNRSDRFSGGGRGSLVHVEPDVCDITPAQKNYLVNYLNQFNTALNSPTYRDPDVGYAKYIDVDGWIDHAWLNIVPKNVDAYRLSGYYHKDRNGLLVAGPIWDYDRTMESTDGRDNAYNTWIGTGDATRFFTFGWWTRLYQDPDFGQKFIDRWHELYHSVYSPANIASVIDTMAEEISVEAGNRNFARWSSVSPRYGSWMGEVNHLKDWMINRVNWVDSQFLTEADFSQAGGVVDTGFQLTFSDPPKGEVYYTLDGSDPRLSGGAISPKAFTYEGDPITLLTTGVVTARVWDGTPWSSSSQPRGGWSAPTEALFVVGEPASAENLAISEIHYHPHDPTAAELATQPAGDIDFVDGDFEFIELLNTSDQPVQLTGVRFSDGIEFAIADTAVTELEPGERIVIAANEDAFAARYDSGIVPAGFYTGRLDNSGEQLTLVNDVTGATIFNFRYDDGGGWPGRADGKGASMELEMETATVAADYATGGAWQSSVAYGGTPGTASAAEVGVIVNEVLNHSDVPLVDAIELYNATDAAIDLGGWYLSDSWGWADNLDNGDYKKFQIVSGTAIPAGGYLTFYEGHYEGDVMVVDPVTEFGNRYDEQQWIGGFALSGARGDDVWLMEADAQGNLTRFADHVDFGAAAANQSLGRWPNADGRLFPMTEPTFGDANAGPQYGPVLISEVMYGPPEVAPEQNGIEYVELVNTSGATVPLFDPARPTQTWQLGGVAFSFPPGVELAPGEVALVSGADPEAFRAAYGVPAAVQVLGPYTGVLDNSGERVRLLYPGETPAPDELPLGQPNYVPYLLADEVNYKPDGLWPVEADEGGASLQRDPLDGWGNDPNNWTAADPTPGSVGAPRVVARHVFYNNSSFDGNDAAATAADDAAIAPDKTPLLPGGVATFANYTSYSLGVTGVMIDVADADRPPEVADFSFRIGNSLDVGTWLNAPDPLEFTVRPGAGQGGSDRVTLTWIDHVIRKQWLEVTVSAAGLGLPTDDVFYFGNAVAESGNTAGNTQVTSTDMLLARNNPRSFLNPAEVDFPYDYNRDARVGATDILLARNNQTNFLTALKMLDLSAVGGQAEASVASEGTSAWTSAVDQLLATFWQ